jgi:hypothetical protein
LAPAPNNPYFFPTIDGDFIVESAAQQLLQEAYVKVPTIIGRDFQGFGLCLQWRTPVVEVD